MASKVHHNTSKEIAGLAATTDDRKLLSYKAVKKDGDLLRLLPQDDHHAKLLEDYFAAAKTNQGTRPDNPAKAAREVAMLAPKRAIVQALAKAFAKETAEKAERMQAVALSDGQEVA